jgi:long-chain acyl-CoA synthetase
VERASREKLPLEIHLVDDLPRGPAGKVVLAEVKAMLEQLRLQPTARSLGNSGSTDVQENVFAVAASTFKTDVRALSLDSDTSNTPDWDSLAHIEFLHALETVFEVRTAPRDVTEIVSLRDAVRAIEAKLAEDEPQSRTSRAMSALSLGLFGWMLVAASDC